MRPTRLCLLLLLFHAVAGAVELPEPGVLRGWIEDMKSSAAPDPAVPGKRSGSPAGSGSVRMLATQ